MSRKTFFQGCCAAIATACCLPAFVAAQAEGPAIKFSKRCLLFDMNEGCAAANVNRDGKPDVIAGK